MFEADLKYLKNEYDVIGYQELCERRNEHTSKRRSSRPSIVLTLDDGYRECFDIVRPLLIKHNIPAIFFVTTGFVDNRTMFYRNKISLCIERVNRLPQEQVLKSLSTLANENGLDSTTRKSICDWLLRLGYEDSELIDRIGSLIGVSFTDYLETKQPYMTKEMLRTLSNDGFTIGAHGLTHCNLGLTHSNHGIREEIQSSCQFVHELTGLGSPPFAFPFTGKRVPRELLSDIRRTCPTVGLLFDSRGLIEDKPFLQQRISSDSSAGPKTRGSNLAGLIHIAYQSQFRQQAISTNRPRGRK